jgi:hypothetical protein
MLRAAKIRRSQRCDRAARRSGFPEAFVAARRSPRHCRLSFADFTFGDTPNSCSQNSLSLLSPKTRQATSCRTTDINQRQNAPATAPRFARRFLLWRNFQHHVALLSPWRTRHANSQLLASQRLPTCRRLPVAKTAIHDSRFPGDSRRLFQGRRRRGYYCWRPLLLTASRAGPYGPRPLVGVGCSHRGGSATFFFTHWRRGDGRKRILGSSGDNHLLQHDAAGQRPGREMRLGRLPGDLQRQGSMQRRREVQC